MLAACFPLTFFKQTISHTSRYFRLIFCLIPSWAFRCTADFMGDRCQYHDVFNLLDEIKGIYGAGFKAGLSSSRHELLQCECCYFLYACPITTPTKEIFIISPRSNSCVILISTHVVETYFSAQHGLTFRSSVLFQTAIFPQCEYYPYLTELILIHQPFEVMLLLPVLHHMCSNSGLLLLHRTTVYPGKLHFFSILFKIYIKTNRVFRTKHYLDHQLKLYDLVHICSVQEYSILHGESTQNLLTRISASEVSWKISNVI